MRQYEKIFKDVFSQARISISWEITEAHRALLNRCKTKLDLILRSECSTNTALNNIKKHWKCILFKTKEVLLFVSTIVQKKTTEKNWLNTNIIPIFIKIGKSVCGRNKTSWISERGNPILLGFWKITDMPNGLWLHKQLGDGQLGPPVSIQWGYFQSGDLHSIKAHICFTVSWKVLNLNKTFLYRMLSQDFKTTVNKL